MQGIVTAIAQNLAVQSGAVFQATPEVAYDRTDKALQAMVPALLERVRAIGAVLLSAERQGNTLVAVIDDEAADLPLTADDFQRAVRADAYRLFGEVWDGRFIPGSVAPQPALVA